MMKTFLDITLLLCLTIMVSADPHDVEQAWKEYKVLIFYANIPYITPLSLIIFQIVLLLSYRENSVIWGALVWKAKILPWEKKSSVMCIRWLWSTIVVAIAPSLWSTICSQSWYNYKIYLYANIVYTASVPNISVDRRREETLSRLCSSITQNSRWSFKAGRI